MTGVFWQKTKKITALLCLDALLVLLSMILARAFLANSWSRLFDDSWGLAGAVVFTLPIFAFCGLYSMSLKNIGLEDILHVCLGVFVAFVPNVLFNLLINGFRIREVLLASVLLFDMVCLVRYWKRFWRMFRRRVVGRKERIPVMIVGAGDAGATIVREMLSSNKIAHLPVCIIDDDPKKVNTRISGVPVVGTRDDIERMVVKYGIQQIFITIPSAQTQAIREICSICARTKCQAKILPGVYQLIEGTAMTHQMRDIDINDLLGREPITVNTRELFEYIEGKSILVTGGGGSIGSELCRQIAAHNPAQLTIFDIYENNAYDIEMELRRNYPYLNLNVLIGSVREERRVRDVFEMVHPQIVFHAAAHKHVPLMETSPAEAVKNNVFGTYNVAKTANDFSVERFVMISTDKAVNPTNVMGATKRICEMIVQNFASISEKTDYVAVRFGNVLGSNGSVIPLFKRQIAEGGPVTVTHKDIIRYFMTIPEAVSLVLQAGAYATGGEIFVLDMGEPVRIVTLAENLIRLSGYIPYEDIDIVFTGLRQGEKLFEELLLNEEGMRRTPNKKIYIGNPIHVESEQLERTLSDMRAAAATNDNATLLGLIKALVPTYRADKRTNASITNTKE